jgi:hypothetical protein
MPRLRRKRGAMTTSQLNRLAEITCILVSIDATLEAFGIGVKDNDYATALLELRTTAARSNAAAESERRLLETRHLLRLTSERLQVANQLLATAEEGQQTLFARVAELERLRQEAQAEHVAKVSGLRTELAWLREENRKLREDRTSEVAR